jgi:peptidoglycan hydrolase CwlO-like protein
MRVTTGLLSAVLLLTVPALAKAVAPSSQPANDASLSQAQAAAKNLQSDIDVLNGQLKEAEGRFTSAEGQLIQVRTAFANEQELQSETSAHLAQAQQSLDETVVALYETSPSAELEMLLSSSTLGEVFDRLKTLGEIETQRSTIVTDVASTRKEVADEQTTLAEQSEQASALVRQIDQQRVQIQQTVQTRQEQLSQTNATVLQLLQQIEAAKAKAAAEAAQRATEAAKQAAAERARTGSASGHETQANSDYTPQSWASALLNRCGLPTTTDNVEAIVAWEMAEGGNWSNTALYNPLNTTMPEPGATSINSVGVKAYTSWDEGFDATIATLFNGSYSGIISALKVGNNAQAVADAVGASPWGTSPFVV